MYSETTITTLRAMQFYGRLHDDDSCDGSGPTRIMPARTVCDVQRGNPYKLALCSTVADGREWYVWTRADDVNASESGDLAERDFMHLSAAPESIRLETSADGREIVREHRTAGETRYRVADVAFNRHHYPDLIGQEFDTPPGHAHCWTLADDPAPMFAQRSAGDWFPPAGS